MRIQFHAVKLVILALGVAANVALGGHRSSVSARGDAGLLQPAGAEAVHQHQNATTPGGVLPDRI